MLRWLTAAIDRAVSIKIESVVVGDASPTGDAVARAFRWMSLSGMQDIGTLGPGFVNECVLGPAAPSYPHSASALTGTDRRRSASRHERLLERSWVSRSAIDDAAR